MRTTSRTILALGLALLALGCGGSKSEPTPDPKVATTPDPDAGKTAVSTATYELDPGKHAVPARPVSGPLGGAEVTPEAAVEEEYLVFRTVKPGTQEVERQVRLKLRAGTGERLPAGKFVVRQETPEGPQVFPVELTAPGKPTHLFPNGYAMTLELEERKGGKLPGKIYLCLPDDAKSFLTGTFVAAAPRLPTEPPEVDDVPLINGTVAVAGAGPGTTLMTGYAAAPNGSTSQVGIAAVDIELGESPAGAKWATLDHDKPRVTSLIAGDGKSLPSRYEHTKLTPGRYLTFAALKNGPAAWKWVDVGPKDTVKVDLALDATKTGGLEVTAPLGSLQKIQLAPADDPGRPALDQTAFELIALQLKLEQDVVARKALFKNLGPGRYEVRDKASGQVRVAEVVAGKTVELDFDARPKTDPKSDPKKNDPAPDPKPKG
jgi:hypothetical protein